MDIREEIKILLLKEKYTITELAAEMEKITGKHYTQPSLSHKLKRDTLRVSEYKLILDILGYELKITKKPFS